VTGVSLSRRAFVGGLAGLGAAVGSILLTGCDLQRGPNSTRKARIGYLSASVSPDPTLTPAFLLGLREHGWIEGQNIEIDYRFAGPNLEDVTLQASDLVRLQVDVIVAAGSIAIAGARKATATIPIVMATASDPLRVGYVSSLARPGGNVTGTSGGFQPELSSKGLELLKLIVPRLSRLANVTNGADPTAAIVNQDIELAASAAGVQVRLFDVRTIDDIEPAFARAVAWQADALNVSSNQPLNGEGERVAKLAAGYRLPAMYQTRMYVDRGGLMSYGTKPAEIWRRAAGYVDKILRGAHPGDLPVEKATTFEFVINLRAANAIGLAIPREVILQATEVIE
jgi:putative ABC transport system substrate-binding protein